MMKAYKLSITNLAEVKAYIQWLADNGLLYHWDDSPTDIVWEQSVDIDCMQLNHCAVWEICDPWEILESDAAIWSLYGLGE